MGNQPRMRSKGLENGKMAFSYVDATNVKSPGELRMTRLVLTFPNSNHLVEEWTSKAESKEDVSRFTLTRRKK